MLLQKYLQIFQYRQAMSQNRYLRQSLNSFFNAASFPAKIYQEVLFCLSLKALNNQSQL